MDLEGLEKLLESGAVESVEDEEVVAVDFPVGPEGTDIWQTAGEMEILDLCGYDLGEFLGR